MKSIISLLSSLAFICSFFALTGCEKAKQPEKTQTQADLVIYSGITMVKPLKVLADEFERLHQIKIHIVQGASGYLYHTLRSQKTGDIYFPGTETYRIEHAEDNILLDRVLVGFNRLSFVVQQGNPKSLNSDIRQLLNPNISVVLASPDSSAVGKATKTALEDANICMKVFENVTYFTTDSHRLFKSLENGHADITMNWYASTVWKENANKVDAIILHDHLQQKRRLELNLLRFSKNPELAKKFMAYASSKHGLKTFADYGFLLPDELATLIKTTE
ncbi:substrate-binding domain-containing protein [Thiomicrorhabdus indica]|uniref:substrate-binding domain-containing protein n=1 Tax=Thiomicrorhabdus indica TaxID=2267253 RepID=UPI0013EE880A|nr:substrate-binding domain-containing protein [Thiomicrorhabdus indica]